MKIVHPGTREEVGELLAAAQSKGTRVAVRGGGTLEQTCSLEGPAPDLLLDLSRMNRITAIEQGNLLARVEAGTVTGALQAAVEVEGLFYPPDPPTLDSCTIGGNIASAAAGPRRLKYGGTRDFVLGLEVVLPNGETIRTGANMQKSVAGYDMTRFLIGSGARFGVVTGAVLRLLPKPQCRQTLLCSLPGFSAAASVALAILKGGLTPAAMELLDRHCVGVDGEAWRSLGLPPRSTSQEEALLLFELDGVEASVKRQRAQIERLCREHGNAAILILADPAEMSRAWELRQRLLSQLIAVNPVWAMAVAAVVPDRLPAPLSLDDTGAAALSNGSSSVACFAHAGSGILHLFVGTDPARERDGDEGLALVRGMIDRLHGVGGRLLGSYGPARQNLGEEERVAPPLRDALEAIRRSFDPKGIMVP